MPFIVSLDLETTGLDPTLDSIIEIGAVKFNENRIESEFSTLINPRKPIPPFITSLTGISNSMVQHAPMLQEALPELVDFIGEAPILGQNIGFDLAFLQKAGAARTNTSIDTYELASVLMPSASRYNLGSLARQLGVLQPATHRALDDAKLPMLFTLSCWQNLKSCRWNWWQKSCGSARIWVGKVNCPSAGLCKRCCTRAFNQASTWGSRRFAL